MANKIKSLLGGGGFYAVLALCVVAVGVGGYFLLLRQEPRQEVPEETPDVQTTAPAELPEHEPVVETVPLEEPEEESAPVSMPEVIVDDTPVVAEEPSIVVSPLQGEVVAAFSVDQLLYNETLDDWRTHDGVDIAAAAGDAVMAASAGTVLSVTDDPMMGTLQTEPLVEEGETVSAGQAIGAVGTTAAAESAQGAHLHFAVTREGEAVDPQAFLDQ